MRRRQLHTGYMILAEKGILLRLVCIGFLVLMDFRQLFVHFIVSMHQHITLLLHAKMQVAETSMIICLICIRKHCEIVVIQDDVAH